MSLELILAMTIAANVLMGFRIYRLERSLECTDVMLHAIMREGAPKLYAHYERWEETTR